MGQLAQRQWTAADSAIHGLASGYLPISGDGTINGDLTLSPLSGAAVLWLNKPSDGGGSRREHNDRHGALDRLPGNSGGGKRQ